MWLEKLQYCQQGVPSEVDGSLSFRDSRPLCCPTVGISVTTEDPKLSVVFGEPSIPTIISAINTSYSGKSGTEEDLALLIIEESQTLRNLVIEMNLLFPWSHHCGSIR